METHQAISILYKDDFPNADARGLQPLQCMCMQGPSNSVEVSQTVGPGLKYSDLMSVVDVGHGMVNSNQAAASHSSPGDLVWVHAVLNRFVLIPVCVRQSWYKAMSFSGGIEFHVCFCWINP